ncbi:MAG: L-threonylcarbamoyladenylate synthase [Bacilli bacterium]|jgi:L-threonylcarbamoyladenylate synthase|nr:L-threonylcarbamoyladenylate synthase [Bacilli bacterium]
MENILSIKFDEATKLLQAGKIVAFPTETVYGLGIIHDSENAFDNLVKIKKRIPDKPFTLMCADISDIDKYAFVNEQARRIIQRFLPGELTIILNTKPGVPKWVDLGTGHIGIRIPDDENVRNMIRIVGKPLLVPSANRADQKPFTTSEEVIAEFHNEIAAVVLGKSKGATPSTVIAAYDKIVMLREGNISLDDIMKVTGGE